MKISLLIPLLFSISQGAIVTQNFDFSPNLAIPDGDPSGLVDVQSITSTIVLPTSITVGRGISGEFTGDLYVSLQHDSGFTVLLNRVGRTAANPLGYADTGIGVTFDDNASENIHLYQDVPATGNPLSGTWQPDGRNVDPSVVTDASPVTAGLSSLLGSPSSGDWTLFVSDVVSGSTHTLDTWSLSITGDTVPEPSGAILALLATGVFMRRQR